MLRKLKWKANEKSERMEDIFLSAASKKKRARESGREQTKDGEIEDRTKDGSGVVFFSIGQRSFM